LPAGFSGCFPAGRPRRVGLGKLARLYARGLDISEELMGSIVSRTKGVSAAFIRELMRRCAQFQIELNRRLLGGEGAE
jgi:hypothetical protein